MPLFEEVSANSNPQSRIEGMKRLIGRLPDCNRTLLQWIFVHMGHVIERERFNKMTLQNVSIVLSPTMRISHRVLNCFFENSHILFEGIYLKKYVPPITGESGGVQSDQKLPESPAAIEEEIKKQESLLADLHLQISSGAASKKTEEQVWEQQRIVTQLKRKLRIAKKSTDGSGTLQPATIPDEDEKLDFRLQVPTDSKDEVFNDETTELESNQLQRNISESTEKELSTNQGNTPFVPAVDPKPHCSDTLQDQTENVAAFADIKGQPIPSKDHDRKVVPQAQNIAINESDLARRTEKSQENEIGTPAFHQRQRSLPASHDVTDNSFQPEPSDNGLCSSIKQTISHTNSNEAAKMEHARRGHVTVIQLNPATEGATNVAFPSKVEQKMSPMQINEVPHLSSNIISNSTQAKPMIPLLPKPPGRDNKTTKVRQHNPILQPTPALSNMATPHNPTVELIKNSQGKKESGQTNLKVNETSDIFKSKSLPRGMPSDFESMSSESSLQSIGVSKALVSNSQVRNEINDMGATDTMPSLNPFPAPKTIAHDTSALKGERDEVEEKRIEELQLELLKVKFENEELEAYKKELEWRKRSERKEMEELREEMATMQTLYQYRTYSVDSSENSSDEGSDKDNVREEAEELAKVLSDLKRENRELEETRAELCKKIQDERSACIQLRVQIKVEQERIERRRRCSSFAP